jgi:hypothetical protein
MAGYWETGMQTEDNNKGALRASLIELTKTIGSWIDKDLRERVGLAAQLSPSMLHRIRSARFQVESYEELNYGENIIPRVSWSAREDYVYGEEGIQDFVKLIQNIREFDSTLTRLVEAERGERDKGMLLLYLTTFVYFATKATLRDRGVSQDRMVDAFIQDLEEDRIQMVVRIGLAGIVVKDDAFEISNGVQLRRLNRTDYHEEYAPLTDKSIDRIPFPSQLISSSVLELSAMLGPKLDPLYGPIGLFDVRIYCSVREFDLLIQQLLPLAHVWEGASELVQSETDPIMEFVHIEFSLPMLSPDHPVFRWKHQYRTHQPRSSFSISKDDISIINLWGALVAKNYSRLVYPSDHRDTPLSLAYSRYVGILRSRESDEKIIRDEVEALEAFFTPGLDTSKAFIRRVAFLVRTVAADENATVSVLYNAYDVRSSYTHRGAGWDESAQVTSTTEEAGFAWESYKGDLARILLVYLRLSITSRILSEVDERTFIDVLDKSEKTGVPETNLASLRKRLSCKIIHVSGFVREKEATQRYQIPLPTLRDRIEKKRIAAIMLRKPLTDGRHKVTYLIPEWALLSLKDELEHPSTEERKTN